MTYNGKHQFLYICHGFKYGTFVGLKKNSRWVLEGNNQPPLLGVLTNTL